MMATLQNNAKPQNRFHIPWWLAACAIVAAVVLFLWEEHEAHILGALPYLILLACPLIHILMHRKHGGGCHGEHGHHKPHDERAPNE
jgi:hypothetical protein